MITLLLFVFFSLLHEGRSPGAKTSTVQLYTCMDLLYDLPIKREMIDDQWRDTWKKVPVNHDLGGNGTARCTTLQP
ncbi:hypothetical protein C8R48DRAFT_700817 [Suillus tomentosus]|nr:hypothetical protein C8R48DRAFT_700817 [Suillus tomentosus]